MELKPFSDEGDEDLLAYEQVLLFPDKTNPYALDWTEFLRVELKKELEGPVASYAFNHRAKPHVRNKWIPKLRLAIKGIPQRMKGEEGMYERAVDALWDGFLVLGDDEARLAKL